MQGQELKYFKFVLVAILILAGILLYSRYFLGDLSFSERRVIQKQKEEILNIAGSEKELDEFEKRELFKIMKGSNFDKFNFSKEEELMILRKLNN